MREFGRSRFKNMVLAATAAVMIPGTPVLPTGPSEGDLATRVFMPLVYGPESPENQTNRAFSYFIEQGNTNLHISTLSSQWTADEAYGLSTRNSVLYSMGNDLANWGKAFEKFGYNIPTTTDTDLTVYFDSSDQGGSLEFGRDTSNRRTSVKITIGTGGKFNFGEPDLRGAMLTGSNEAASYVSTLRPNGQKAQFGVYDAEVNAIHEGISNVASLRTAAELFAKGEMSEDQWYEARRQLLDYMLDMPSYGYNGENNIWHMHLDPLSPFSTTIRERIGEKFARLMTEGGYIPSIDPAIDAVANKLIHEWRGESNNPDTTPFDKAISQMEGYELYDGKGFHPGSHVTMFLDADPQTLGLYLSVGNFALQPDQSGYLQPHIEPVSITEMKIVGPSGNLIENLPLPTTLSQRDYSSFRVGFASRTDYPDGTRVVITYVTPTQTAPVDANLLLKFSPGAAHIAQRVQSVK